MLLYKSRFFVQKLTPKIFLVFLKDVNNCEWYYLLVLFEASPNKKEP